MRAIIDKGLGKLLSRKLLAFGVATAALFTGWLTGGDWMTIAVAYVGSQAFVDVVERLTRAQAGS